LQPREDVRVGIAFERRAKRGVEAPRLRDVGRALRRIEIAEMALHQRR
jgi:hypothetical protein